MTTDYARGFRAGIEAALNALDERLTLIGGCGDGGCLVMPPKGMHTNGGCRCMWDKYKAQKTVYAYMAFVRAIRALAPAAPEPSEADVERVAIQIGEPVTLAECPVGLFLYDQTLALKTEYGDNEGRIDAYIVETGEFFWGGAISKEAQRQLVVRPVAIRAALAAGRV